MKTTKNLYEDINKIVVDVVDEATKDQKTPKSWKMNPKAGAFGGGKPSASPVSALKKGASYLMTLEGDYSDFTAYELPAGQWNLKKVKSLPVFSSINLKNAHIVKVSE